MIWREAEMSAWQSEAASTEVVSGHAATVRAARRHARRVAFTLLTLRGLSSLCFVIIL